MATASVTRRELSLPRMVTRRGRSIRIVVALIVVALGATAAYVHQVTRDAEAFVSAEVLKGVFGYNLYAWRDQIIFKLGEGQFDVIVLRVTLECTSLVVLIPLLLFAAGILVFTRVGIGRWLISVLVAVAIVFMVNIVRIATIGYMLREFGRDGYAWSHTVIGTGIIAVGTVIAVITMLSIQAKGKRRRG